MHSSPTSYSVALPCNTQYWDYLGERLWLPRSAAYGQGPDFGLYVMHGTEGLC